MPLDLTVSHLLLVHDSAGPRGVGRSAGVSPALEEAALQTAAHYGPPKAAALFVVDLSPSTVAIVRTAVEPSLAFHFLVLGRPLYDLLGDPFQIADRYPPPWAARGDLPGSEWPAEPLPRRTVAQILDAFHAGDMPWLLGGAQSLIDGGRLVFESDTPDELRVRRLWQLLPDRSRAELRPATFAASLALNFHVTVTPAPPPFPANHLTAEQTRDYPEGRYELALQIAVETGDQAGLDRLFARRTSADMLRFALTAVGVATVAALVVKLAL